MEPENSQPFPRVTPASVQTTDQSRQRVSAYDLMVVDSDLEGLDQEKEEALSLGIELELEASVREQILELEKNEEQVNLVEEDTARKIEASIIEPTSALEEKENESDLQQLLEADVVKLPLEMQNDEMVVSQLNAQEKLPCLLQGSREIDFTEEKQVSASSPVQVSQGHEGDIEVGVVYIYDSDEDTEQLNCVESEFNDFTKTMSSFLVGQVWALYDNIDSMPRWYARIKQVTKSQSSLRVTWLESKDDESFSLSCGRFKWGITETISHLSFSHEMHPIIRGNHFISVNPREGETWALFRDWSKCWNNNPEKHKPPYRYDFVEVLHSFDDRLGVGVAYLGKVEGFVSVFKKAKQHGLISFMINPDEMHRFSHRVPSFKLNGEEKEGVPAGSFELDPAAIPSSILSRDQSEETEQESEVFEDQDGSRMDIPIVLD